TQAVTANPSSVRAARTDPPRHRSSLGVGGDLHADHAVGVDYRLALLDLVDHLHAGEDLPHHRVLAVEEGTVGIHDEELRIRRVRIARACHADDAALARHIGEFG